MDRSITTLAVVWALASMGCVPPMPLEANWGDAVADYRAAMIVNPDAGTTDPIEGVDPLTGEIIIDTYTAEQRNKNDAASRLFMVNQ